MNITLNKDIIKEIIVIEEFFNQVPEYFFLKEAGAKISAALDDKGGCAPCTESGLVNPTIAAFISHTVNMRMDCGPESVEKFKQFLKTFYNNPELVLKVFFKETEDSEIVEFEI